MAIRTIDAEETKNWDRFYRSQFFNSLGGFKSANLVGTHHHSHGSNLALFFSVIHVGAKPPLLGLLFRPPTDNHQTYRNIKENGCFSINAVHQDILRQAHQTSANYAAGRSEFEATGLTEHWLAEYPVPLVEEARIRCVVQLCEEHEIKANGTIFMVGEIKTVQIDNTFLHSSGLLDHAAAKSVAINSLENYYQTEHLAHFNYARPEQNS